MISGLQDSIEIVDLLNRSDTDIDSGMIDMPWHTVVEMFSNHERREHKNGPAFMPVRLKKRDKWVEKTNEFGEKTLRHDGNIDAMTMGVFDLDDEGSIEKAKEVLNNFEYFVYSTHSYTPETPYKFRMVLKLSEPIPADDWRPFYKAVAKEIGSDPNCVNQSRLYYYPSCSPTNPLKPHFEHNEGRSLSLNEAKNFTNYKKPKDKKEFIRRESIDTKTTHFSGEATQSKIDYTFEGMKKRHNKLINNLIVDDSRNAFAMHVLLNESSLYGSKIDLLSTYQFIYRCASDYSSKPLHHGNTPEELKRLTLMGLNKAGVTKEEIKRKIPTYLKEASDRNLSGKWHFPEMLSIGSRQSGDKKSSLHKLRAEYISEMKGFVKTGDRAKLVIDVIDKLTKSKNPDIDLRTTIEFLFYCDKNRATTIDRKDYTGSNSQEFLTIIKTDPRIQEGIASSSLSKGLVDVFSKVSKSSSDNDIWNFETTKQKPAPEISVSI